MQHNFEELPKEKVYQYIRKFYSTQTSKYGKKIHKLSEINLKKIISGIKWHLNYKHNVQSKKN